MVGLATKVLLQILDEVIIQILDEIIILPKSSNKQLYILPFSVNLGLNIISAR